MAVRRRKRQDVQSSEFKDPLENYDAPVYEDNLERAVAEICLSEMEITPVVTVTAEWTVGKVIELMAERGVASVMVVEDDQLIGVFSERDVLNRVAGSFDQLHDKSITRVMTRDPVVAYETDRAAKAMNLMATSGIRHVPVLDVDDKLIGVLGPRRMGRFLREHFREQ